MPGKFSFHLRRAEPRAGFPAKIVVGRQDLEPTANVVLKALGYLLFFRERLQMDVNLHMDSIPFRPHLVQLDYELRPQLWVECGEVSVNKLAKLAVKVPEAEIWVIQGSLSTIEELIRAMAKADLRRHRYNLIGLDAEMFDELCALLRPRNEILWVNSEFSPPNLQFDFNGLWFDAPFTALPF